MIGLLRTARGITWLAAAAVAWWQLADLDRRLLRIDEDSTFRQSTSAQLGLVTMVAILITALAADRLLELAERRMLERRGESKKALLE